MTNHPEPMVAAEVSLRGLPWMRLDTDRLLNSDLFALATGDEFKAAVALWCKSWSQEPAGSLPIDDRILAHLSGTGARWRRLKGMALRGWVECNDGRLYHPVVAEQVALAWAERLEHLDRNQNEQERKARYRKLHKALRDELRKFGIVAPWDEKVERLRKMLADAGGDPEQVSRDTFGQTCDEPATRPERGEDATRTAKTGRDGTGREVIQVLPDNSSADRTLEGSAAALARALVECGFQGASADGTLILDAVAEGVTVGELQAIVREKQGKPLVYVLNTAIGRKRDAKAAGTVNGSAPPPTLDPKAKAQTEARHERDAEILEAKHVHGLGLIDEAQRDERITTARSKYQAKAVAGGWQEQRA